MEGVKNLLTRKVAGIPGWVIAAAGGVAIWYFFLRGGASSSGSATTVSGSAAVSGDSGSTSDGVSPSDTAPTPTAAPSPAVSPKSSPALDPKLVALQSAVTLSRGAWYAAQKTGDATLIKMTGNALNRALADLAAYQKAHPGSGSAAGPVSNGGVGGGRSTGSRSAVIMHYAHPRIKRRVVYSHYVKAIGGPANHQAEVHRVAAASGVHPARLLALNPEYTGKIRIA